MKVPMTIFRWLFCLCLAVLAGCRPQVDPSGFGGTWVLTVNQQVLMVLTLQRDGETYRGTWQRPKQFNTDGLAFTGLSSEVVTETISSASSNGKTLLFVTRDPNDASAGTEFEMTLQTQESASVGFAGVAFEPWTFVRYQAGTPEVFRGWDNTRSVPTRKTLGRGQRRDAEDRRGGSSRAEVADWTDPDGRRRPASPYAHPTRTGRVALR